MLELFHYLENIYPVNSDIQTYLMRSLKRRELINNQYWLREGDICNRIAYIEKGLVKFFYHNSDKEIIVKFCKEHDVVIAARSFFEQKPSSLSIKTMEPTVLSYLDYRDIDYLCQQYKDFNIHAKRIIQKHYCRSEEHLMLMYLPPRERYFSVLKKFPWMTKRIKDKYIAAYLGITNVALSRFRRASA